MKTLVIWFLLVGPIGLLISLPFGGTSDPGNWFAIGGVPALVLSMWIVRKGREREICQRARDRYLEEQELDRLRQGRVS